MNSQNPIWHFPLWPEQASAYAYQVDQLTYALIALAAAFGIGVVALLATFAIHYRTGNKGANRDGAPSGLIWLEVAWITIPLALALGTFGWAAYLYVGAQTPPRDALTVFVVGRQWMWKFYHPAGAREIDELHVPLGKPVRLVMTSQDVIHSLFLPAMRVKQDVVPGRFTSLWFAPTRTGTFPIYCAEYCGTEHSRMRGRVVVEEPFRYEAWLRASSTDGTLAAQGARHFRRLGCSGCHMAGGGNGPCPPLEGVYGGPVPLVSGEVVMADERYLMDSILRPNAQIVAGYGPMMPSFAGQIGEDELVALVAYLKSLASAEEGE